VFFEFREIVGFAFACCPVAFGIWLFGIRVQKSSISSIAVRAFAIFFLLVGIFGVSVWSYIVFTTHKSTPIYSPDHRRAARIEGLDDDRSFVIVYSGFGFGSRMVFLGGWTQAEAKKIRWVSDHELAIEYDGPSPPALCKSGGGVSVRCEPVLSQSN
jgi:hypothetical protein